MTTKISTGYDQLITLVEATFPSHVELINAYIPELNDDLTFDAAWGLALAPGVNSTNEIGCRLAVERDFIFTLTRKIYKGDLARNSSSRDHRRLQEKQLFEDQYLIINALENDPSINATAKVLFINDGGLEFVRGERNDLIMLRSTFQLEYWENLT